LTDFYEFDKKRHVTKLTLTLLTYSSSSFPLERRALPLFTPWSRTLLQNLTIAQLIRKHYPSYMAC